MPPAEAAPTEFLRSVLDGLERTFEPAVNLEQAEFFRTRLTPSTQTGSAFSRPRPQRQTPK
jgi:hypothetical protein